MNRLIQHTFAILACLLIVSSAWAEVKLPSVFSDNMVLQRDKPIRVWGWADAGEEVTVTIKNQTKSTTADAKGQWDVTLDKLSADGKSIKVIIKGNNTITLSNVLMGEVWLCSGQSNMQWSVAACDNAKEEIAAANYPKIRLLTVPTVTATTPQTNFKGQWVECTPDTIKGFSAVGYYFGRYLHKDMNVPIGLINSSWGGTRVEPWVNITALQKVDEAKPLLQWWNKQSTDYDLTIVKANYEKALAKWKVAADKTKTGGKHAPRKPRMRANPRNAQQHPANLYNAMIAPLTPLSIRGAIWYQGESNVARADQYRHLFKALIENWRNDFINPDMPFGFVQLAPYSYGGNRESLLPELWDAQLDTLKNTENVGMAVITDIGNTKNIHPKNKQDVGKRLGLWALAKVYDKNDIVYSGPIYTPLQTKNNTITLTFNHTGSGLTTSNGQPPSHFTIAGEDKKFYPANAKIVGNKIVVSSDQVANPVAVRFGWSNTAEPNLQNKEGLPASPFRTDNWPLKTKGQLTP